jgi:hypothetical protein
VDSIHNGDYLKVKGVDFGSGAQSFNARVASAGSGGSIELRLDTLTGPLAGTCSVTGTGGWQMWTTKSCTVTGATGVHDLYLKFTGSSGKLFTFNWWKFTSAVGLGSASETVTGEFKNTIKVLFDAGKTQTLLLDFSLPISQGNVHVRLFGLNGRLVTTLFAGRLSTRNLSLPLNRAEVRTGAYVVRVSMDDEIIMTKTFALQRK